MSVDSIDARGKYLIYRWKRPTKPADRLWNKTKKTASFTDVQIERQRVNLRKTWGWFEISFSFEEYEENTGNIIKLSMEFKMRRVFPSELAV